MTNLKEKDKSCNKDIEQIISDCYEYRNKLIEHCQIHLDNDYEAACDCVQNAYLALYEALMKGARIKNYRAWLYKVTMNYRNQLLRDRIKRNEDGFLSNEAKDKKLENTVIYNPDYVESMVSDLDIERRCIQILSSLTTEEKNLYIDHYLKKKTFAEIGANLNIKMSTIERRHAKLKKKIIKMIKNIEK